MREAGAVLGDAVAARDGWGVCEGGASGRHASQVWVSSEPRTSGNGCCKARAVRTETVEVSWVGPTAQRTPTFRHASGPYRSTAPTLRGGLSASTARDAHATFYVAYSAWSVSASLIGASNCRLMVLW